MKKSLLVLCIFIMFTISCTSPDTIIKPDHDTGDVKISCMQVVLSNNQNFQPEFKFDKDIPELVVYAKGAYANLSDKGKDSALEAVGRQWQSCYPDDFRPMTLWLKDVNHMIITVIFVTK